MSSHGFVFFCILIGMISIQSCHPAKNEVSCFNGKNSTFVLDPLIDQVFKSYNRLPGSPKFGENVSLFIFATKGGIGKSEILLVSENEESTSVWSLEYAFDNIKKDDSIRKLQIISEDGQALEIMELKQINRSFPQHFNDQNLQHFINVVLIEAFEEEIPRKYIFDETNFYLFASRGPECRKQKIRASELENPSNGHYKQMIDQIMRQIELAK